MRVLSIFGLICLIPTAAFAQTAGAGERKFVVILANSPKQYPGPERDPPHQPTGGLPDSGPVDEQYFDTTSPEVGSFAEYWEEVSYGLITITGETLGWIDLPWAIQPPLSDAEDDDPQSGPPPDAARITPEHFCDLDADGQYSYGQSETFLNWSAKVPVDLDGDPFGQDNGPFEPGLGGLDASPFADNPVWKPGERFVDIDADGRWDGLDEAGNEMDWNLDGRPDNDGPWVDLDGDGEPENEDGCIYLWDADNDGHPDCCPDGATAPGCTPFDPQDPDDASCPATQWWTPDDQLVIDCNGNLIDDSVDIDSGTSQDSSPGPDGIPDECQGPNGEYLPQRTPKDRCEYHDANGDATLDIVEPFENFLRRWDPCLFDPDVSPENFHTPPTHWIKVFDPGSDSILSCDDPETSFAYDFYSRNPDPAKQTPSYIEDNYAGHFEMLEDEAQVRVVYGQHDPLGKLAGEPCLCAVAVDGTPGGACTDFDINGDGAVDPETETNVCRAGVHAGYDAPDLWVNRLSSTGPGGPTLYTTKMRVAPGSNGTIPYVTATPEPGQTGSPIGDEDWFQQAWHDRYAILPNLPSSAPPWPVGFDPDGSTPMPNTPLIEPWDELDPDTYDPALHRRFFRANRGGLNGDGSGWLGEGNEDLLFETGPLGENGFEQALNAAILPEEVDGPDQPGIYFDGYVEHDDLPSSKYHTAGDERLGEVTSPWSDQIWGEDLGDHQPGSPGGPDLLIAAAGPYAVNVHGTMGRDAGNLLLMEYLTWRTDGTSPTYGYIWEWYNGTNHPYAGPGMIMSPNENLGFRDYNLDGMIDQGEVRPAGSENYLADPVPSTPNNGLETIYPFNRRRLVEDCIAIVDEFVDFDDFVDPVAMERVACPETTLSAQVPPQFGINPNSGSGLWEVEFNGILSGIVLLPDGSVVPSTTADTEREFDRPPHFHPIHNEDSVDPEDSFPPGATHQVTWNLAFHDLVMHLDADPLNGYVPTENFMIAYAAHQYMNAWETFPDLSCHDVYGPWPGCPDGTWDIMSPGGMVHPNPELEATPCTEWIEPVDLTTVLIPGIEQTLTLPPYELVQENNTYVLYEDTEGVQSFYFWSVGQGFDQSYPGSGMLILHYWANGCPLQPFPDTWPPPPPAYAFVPADNEMDGVCADAGDPWPGTTGNTAFNCSTTPAAHWYGEPRCTGLDISAIDPDPSGEVQFTVSWIPTSIPGLRFDQPITGSSYEGPGDPPAMLFDIDFDVADLYGGSWIRVFHTDDPDDVTVDPGGGNYVGAIQKIEPDMVRRTVTWDLSDTPDGDYRFFAELIPAVGAEGEESAWTNPRPGDRNVGDGNLTIEHVDVNELRAFGQSGLIGADWFKAVPPVDFAAEGIEPDDQLTFVVMPGQRAYLRSVTEVYSDELHFAPPLDSPLPDYAISWQVVRPGGTARLETWFLMLIQIDENTAEWVVTSSLSGPDPGDHPHAQTGVPYTSAGGEVTLLITEGDIAFAPGDTFIFTTTGTTVASDPVTVEDGEIDPFLMGDWNLNGHIDLDDYEVFWLCLQYSGPDIQPLFDECAQVFDFDDDNDVDLFDFSAFELHFTD